jgi:DNA-directed RNA polymerase subunit RPC12/RpoP
VQGFAAISEYKANWGGCAIIRPILGAPGPSSSQQKESVMAVSGYCLKCKKKVDIKDPQHITMKNGKPATTGTCPTCGTKIYKIGKA